MGFEPTDPFEPPVFKTGAIDHSTNLPYLTGLGSRIRTRSLRVPGAAVYLIDNIPRKTLVPLVGLEPTCRKTHDFESCVSTSSTTPADIGNR